ncbi:MAG: MiaB/RimO family radical SAM methylthiotransferase [Phycisphaerales bacterium JB039]
MPARSVYLETFGCQMNELDSELVAGQLAALGYQFTPDATEADVVLYNTCSVREQAEQKVWSRLGEMKAVKRRRPDLVVGVLGCMAERDGADMIRRFPAVDVMCGPGELDKLPGLLDNAVRTRASMLADAPNGRAAASISAAQLALQGNTSRRTATLAAAEDTLELLDLSRAVSPIDPAGGARRSAYVRITRGCNKFCTYCVVPFTRGAETHRPPDHIVDECRRLADAGVIEVTLLGQTVNHYRYEHGAMVSVGGVQQPQKGRSFKGGHRRDPLAGASVTTFADLLRRIHEEVPEIQRLRFVTSYPRDFGDDVLEVMRDSPRICRYLHVPAQSGSDAMLKRMNRGYTVGEYFEFLDRARAFLDEPDRGRPLSLSGDIIVGFPGETDADFAATVDLVQKARYKNCFIFKYSPRPGTVAYDRIPDDIPEYIKRQRNNDLLAVQARISDEIGQEQVGRTFDVMVEGYSQKELKRRGMTKGQIRASEAVAGAGAVTLTVGGAAPHGSSPMGGAGFQPADGAPPLLHTPTVQLSGRTDGDLIVFLEAPTDTGPEDLIGRIVPVRITSADRLSLFGEVV